MLEIQCYRDHRNNTSDGKGERGGKGSSKQVSVVGEGEEEVEGVVVFW